MLAHRSFRLAAVLAASLALVGCGETTRIAPTSKATPRVPPTVTPTVFPAPTSAAASPAESGSATPSATAASSAPAGKPGEVQAAGTSFTPKSMTVRAGEAVTWVSKAGEFHSVTSGEPGSADSAGPMNAPIGFPTYSVTFSKPGTYKYFCQPHASVGMVGEIVVT